jgi:cyclophilin family peptidyl-prolyl cis-trans isomerase
VFLAQHDFYDGLTFHRVIENFVAQAGDPTASGFDDAGYALDPESNALRFDAGVISMAKAGTRVSGSQFFVTLGPAPHLNGEFTVFGRVIDGLDVLQALPARDPSDGGVAPAARILDITIIEGNGQ